MSDAKARRVAVVLFNLGAPDRPEAIRPFLRNLFADPAILRVPPPIRPLLSALITSRRVKPATENYMLLGGSSPLLAQTEAQAQALSAVLAERLENVEARCFIAMRYWHPRAEAVVQDVLRWQPDEVVLLPLYPQYSTTTTGSSLTEWRAMAAKHDLVVRTASVCCWYTQPGYIASFARLLAESLEAARMSLPQGTKLRVLYSAHGLPESIVTAGDPYQMQVEAAAAAMSAAIGLDTFADTDAVVCYQSRATPQKWLEPSTEQALAAAAADRRAVVVVPLAFVSEHSETLVELDIEYRHLADRLGLPGYVRVPTPTLDADFIGGLSDLVCGMLTDGPGVCRDAHSAPCGAAHRDCPQRRRVRA